MALSDQLEEAASYYYVRTKDGKTAGGPYPNLAKLGAGILRAERRGLARDQLVAQKLIGGRWHDLSVDEKEALLASMG